MRSAVLIMLAAVAAAIIYDARRSPGLAKSARPEVAPSAGAEHGVVA